MEKSRGVGVDATSPRPPSTAHYRERLYAQYATSLGQTGAAPGRAHYYDQRILPHLEGVSGPILELGCGDGGLMLHLKQRGFTDVTGVDTSPEQVQRAQAAGVQAERGEALPFLAARGAKSCDAVIAIDVLEHLYKSETLLLLDEILRVLRPGGRLLVHTVNAASPFFGAVRFGDFTHENAFTTQSLSQVLNAVGFHDCRGYEDAPVVHGTRSLARALLWPVVRSAAVFAQAVETGHFDPRGVLTRNFLLVATRP